MKGKGDHKMNTIKEIRDMQFQIISTINTTFEKIVKKFEELEQNESIVEQNEFQVKYPITYAGFKGTKPIAVIINSNEIITPSWKSVVENILKEVIKDKTMEQKLMNLRNIILGRTRTRIASNEGNMRSPILITEGLYIETHYDTEALMKFLLEILDSINYDYSKIEIRIKN